MFFLPPLWFPFLCLCPSWLIFCFRFSASLVFPHPALTFFCLLSLWNWFLTSASAIVQGPPGLPGLKGDPGSKGEKVGVALLPERCFVSQIWKRLKKWRKLWTVIMVQISSVRTAHRMHKSSDWKQHFFLNLQRIVNTTVGLCEHSGNKMTLCHSCCKRKLLQGLNMQPNVMYHSNPSNLFLFNAAAAKFAGEI